MGGLFILLSALPRSLPSCGQIIRTSPKCRRVEFSDDFQQKQDDDDQQNQANSTPAIVAEPWTHAIAAKPKNQEQNDENNEHFLSFLAGDCFASKTQSAIMHWACR